MKFDMVLVLAMALVSLMAVGESREIVVRSGEGNRTPDVVRAVKAVPDGGTVRFEKGEYHFFVEGASKRAVKMANGTTGEKQILIDLVGRKNVTIDGGGASFVWHGNLFPVAVDHGENITVKNYTSRCFRPSYAEFRIVKFHDDGFTMKFDEGVAWRVTEGSLQIDTDLGTFDSRNSAIALHALDRCSIHFIFLGNTICPRVGLPSTFMNAVAEKQPDGTLRVYNRHQDFQGCLDVLPFKAGEPLAMLLNGRERCGILFAECKNSTVSNVTFESGDGMGIVSLFGEGLLIDRYRVVPRKDAKVSITADCLFVVNNRGKVEVRDSELSRSMDDAMNIHGLYMKAKAKGEGEGVVVSPIHRGLKGINPFRVGDEVEFSAALPSREVIGTARVSAVRFLNAEDVELVFDKAIKALPKGALVENVSAVPSSVHIHDSYFHDTMHLRLSGRSPYLVERNRFERGIAILISDLPGYWGECGRTSDMTIRDNTFVAFDARGGGGGFIVAEVEGRDPSQPPPKVHRGIKILNNKYSGLRTTFTRLTCADNPQVEGNVEVEGQR